jgi:hypothetical protein
MSTRYSSNEQLFVELRDLIDAWCDRRCLGPLGILLPAYTSFNGMTDGWGELLNALKALTLSQDTLLPEERKIVADMRQAAEDVLHARLRP